MQTLGRKVRSNKEAAMVEEEIAETEDEEVARAAEVAKAAARVARAIMVAVAREERLPWKHSILATRSWPHLPPRKKKNWRLPLLLHPLRHRKFKQSCLAGRHPI